MELKVFAFFAVAILLSGCITTELYVRKSVTFDQYQRDTVSCATDAIQSVPASNQVGWAPYVGIYTVDANEQLRMANKGMCLRDKGYAAVAVSLCSGPALSAALAEAKAATTRRNVVMTVGTSTCYVNTASGETYLYTPKI